MKTNQQLVRIKPNKNENFANFKNEKVLVKKLIFKYWDREVIETENNNQMITISKYYILIKYLLA